MNELVEVVHGRNNPGIDPVLHAWGWEVPVYLFLGGMVAGLMILLPALEWRSGRVSPSRAGRLMPFVALVLISLGMGALFLDLEYKLHVYRFYLTFEPTSPMSWGSWILLAVYPALLLLGLGGLTDGDLALLGERIRRPVDRLRGFAARRRPTLLILSVVTGIGLGAYTGLLLGTLSARLLWGTPLLGPLFLVSGVSTGAALLMLVPLGDEETETVGRWDAVALGVELALILLMVLGFSTGGAAAQAAVAPLLGGGFTPVFWGLVVGLGLLVPLALELIEMRTHQPRTVLAPIFVLLGGFVLRAVIVAAGQETTFAQLG